MTDEAKKKIYLMYELFGCSSDKDAVCKNCDHLRKHNANRTWYKCECYGDTSSEATDWRISWTACGLFNKPYEGQKSMIEIKKHYGRKKKQIEIEGQMTLWQSEK